MIYHDPSHGWLLGWWHWLNPTLYPEEFQHFMGFHHVISISSENNKFYHHFHQFSMFSCFFLPTFFPPFFSCQIAAFHGGHWHLQVGDMSSLTQGRAGRRLATSRKPSEWLAGI
jgi:hypothetical protein